MKSRDILRILIPPIVPLLYRRIFSSGNDTKKVFSIQQQNEGSYWASHAGLLNTWGEEHVWNEIQMLLYRRTGNVLDIACGTGTVMKKIAARGGLDVYGVDNSPDLIAQCRSKGIPDDHLLLQDVTTPLPYPDNFFDYSYSIGLLHYLTEEHLDHFVSENFRITRHISFHKLPVSKSGKNEYAVHSWHEYINNSADWWIAKFKEKFQQVEFINSGWKDTQYNLSDGIWLICAKNQG